MDTPSELRRRAERYRRMKWQISDPATLKAICELAGEFEATAEKLEKQHHVRERAQEIWIARGRPDGYDVEIWLAAERDVDSQQKRSR
jgi:hypothetical protein